MKKIWLSILMSALVACSDESAFVGLESENDMPVGRLSVNVIREDTESKSLTECHEVLDTEKAEHKVEVFVFDKTSGALGATKTLNSVSEDCTFSLPVGQKVIYVVVNGPDLSSVTTLDGMRRVAEDFYGRDIDRDGFVMMGYEECDLSAECAAEPVVVVKRLVSRIVLQRITSNIPAQYGKLKVDCVFLGNANTRMTLGGEVSEMMNLSGCDKIASKPIGKDGNLGSYDGYLFRASGVEIPVGASDYLKYYLYCHPNSSTKYTCLYLLTTIGDKQYYYRVPFYNGLKSNATYSVDVEIVNLGAQRPPDGDIQKGEIVADIKIDGWDQGDNYSVMF